MHHSKGCVTTVSLKIPSLLHPSNCPEQLFIAAYPLSIISCLAFSRSVGFLSLTPCRLFSSLPCFSLSVSLDFNQPHTNTPANLSKLPSHQLWRVSLDVQLRFIRSHLPNMEPNFGHLALAVGGKGGQEWVFCHCYVVSLICSA